MTTRPYTLVLGGRAAGFFRSSGEALERAYTHNKNRERSSGGEKRALSIKIYHETREGPVRIVHEEEGELA